VKTPDLKHSTGWSRCKSTSLHLNCVNNQLSLFLASHIYREQFSLQKIRRRSLNLNLPPTPAPRCTDSKTYAMYRAWGTRQNRKGEVPRRGEVTVEIQHFAPFPWLAGVEDGPAWLDWRRGCWGFSRSPFLFANHHPANCDNVNLTHLPYIHAYLIFSDTRQITFLMMPWYCFGDLALENNMSTFSAPSSACSSPWRLVTHMHSLLHYPP